VIWFIKNFLYFRKIKKKMKSIKLIILIIIFQLSCLAQYNVNQIPYVIEPTLGTLEPMSDDAVSSAKPIGFTFCFWGNRYTEFYIGSNGWIGFTAGQTTAFVPQLIPNNGALTPRNAIFSPFHDLRPDITPPLPLTHIRYYTTGVAPYRRLVVSWTDLPMYQCTMIRSSQQIIIYETTNIIQTNITKKSNCIPWVGGKATHGLHNINGTQAVVVNTRNASLWSINPNGESWVFIPDFCCTVYNTEIIIE